MTSQAPIGFDGSTLRKVALGLVAAKMVLVTLVFDPGAYVVFAHSKALVAHALGFALLGVLIALGLRHGRSLLPFKPLHVAVAGVVAVSALATLFAIDRQVALYGTLDRQLGLVTLLDNVILYFAIVMLVRSRADLLVLGGATGVALVSLLTYAVVQRAGLDPLMWRSGIATARPFAMLGNPGNLAQFFGTVAAAGGGALVVYWSRLSTIWRSGLVAWTMLGVAGAALSGARAVGLGLGAAAMLLGVLLIIRLPSRWKALAALGAALVLAVGLGVGGREIIGTGIDLVTGRVPITEGSIAGRVDIYRVALHQVAERPLLGVGPDNYVVAYPRYRSAEAVQFHESDAPQTSPHSWLLKVATDSGVLGLIAYAVVFGMASWFGVRMGGLALVGLASVVSFFATGLVSIGDVGTEWLLWVGLGLIAVASSIDQPIGSPAETRRRGRSPTPPRVAGGRAGLAWLAIALGVGLGLVQYNALEASRSAASSRQARQSSSPALGAAIASAQRAVKLDSGRSEYWQELGLARAANGDFRAAEDAFRRAAEAAPYQAVYLTNLAKAQIAAGQKSGRRDFAEALSTARRAIATDPYLADAHYTLALALYANGSAAEAAAESERGYALRPQAADATVYELAARAYLASDKPAEALEWISRGGPYARSAEDSIDLRLLRAEALIAQRRILDAAAEIISVQADNADDSRARQLRERLVAPADHSAISERFQVEPAWTVLDGDSVGDARNGILTAAPARTSSGEVGSWRVLAGDPGVPAVRISLQVRMPEPSAGTYLELGRWAGPSDALVFRYDVRAQTISFIRRLDTVDEEVASGILRTIRSSMWYWIEVELRGTDVLALIALSGADPGSLGGSTLIGVLEGDARSPLTRGSIMIASDLFPPIQIGGMAEEPGGFYVQTTQAR